MRRVFGPRFVVEAAFLVAVPLAALAAGLGALEIVVSAAAAYLVVLAFETVLARGVAPIRRPRLSSGRARRALSPRRAGVWREWEEMAPEERSLEAAGERPAEAAVVRVVPDAVGGHGPEPAPIGEAEAPAVEPVPEPVVLVPVPGPEPEPEPVAAPVPEPVAEVVPLGAAVAEQRWNIWELERLARERAGGDALRDEERSFLLLYLREYADPSGALPPDFDGLVRESFGELVGVA